MATERHSRQILLSRLAVEVDTLVPLTGRKQKHGACYNLEKVAQERKIPSDRAQVEGFFLNGGKANRKMGSVETSLCGQE